jgi:DNA invertase Pin-like site-specific DNA recombinase
MSKHIAVYVRVSSKQQTTASQLPDLQRWAEAQDDEVRWYEDKASGKSMDRPGWNKLEEKLRQGKVSTVVCWRIDRLGRTCSGLSALFDDLRQRKVNLVSLKDGLDLSTPAGRMMANVLASVAQFETEIRAERQREGIAAAKAAGKRWGGSKPGVCKKVSPTQVKMIRAMKEQGESITAIAQATHLSRPTIYSVLHRTGHSLGPLSLSSGATSVATESERCSTMP